MGSVFSFNYCYYYYWAHSLVNNFTDLVQNIMKLYYAEGGTWTWTRNLDKAINDLVLFMGNNTTCFLRHLFHFGSQTFTNNRKETL